MTAWSHPNSRVEDHRLELAQLPPAPNSHPVPRRPPQHGHVNKRAAKGTQVVCNFIRLWGDPHTNKNNSSSAVNKATSCTSISPDCTVKEKIRKIIYKHWQRIPAHPRWYPERPFRTTKRIQKGGTERRHPKPPLSASNPYRLKLPRKNMKKQLSQRPVLDQEIYAIRVFHAFRKVAPTQITTKLKTSGFSEVFR